MQNEGNFLPNNDKGGNIVFITAEQKMNISTAHNVITKRCKKRKKVEGIWNIIGMLSIFYQIVHL